MSDSEQNNSDQFEILDFASDVYGIMAAILFFISVFFVFDTYFIKTALFITGGIFGWISWICNRFAYYKTPCWIPFAAMFYKLGAPLRKKIKWRDGKSRK